MGGKLMLVAGLATGYVLGSRAGRQRYEQIKSAAGRFWNSKSVQKQVHTVEDFAKDKAPDVVDFVSGKAKKAVGKTGKTGSADSSTASSDPSI